MRVAPAVGFRHLRGGRRLKENCLLATGQLTNSDPDLERAHAGNSNRFVAVRIKCSLHRPSPLPLVARAHRRKEPGDGEELEEMEQESASQDIYSISDSLSHPPICPISLQEKWPQL